MHPLKIIILLVLFYLLYRLYLSGRKKRRLAEQEAERRRRAAIDDVLVQDPVCGAYVPSGRALRLSRAGREYHFCSEKCRHDFQEGRMGRERKSGGSEDQ